MIKSIVKSESSNLKKYTDTTFQVDFKSLNTYVTIINFPTAGATEMTRIGSSINLDSFECRFGLQITQSAPSETISSLVRIIVVQWFGESIPQYDDILDNVGSPIGFIVSPLKYDTNKRLFRVLYDVHTSVDTFSPQKYLHAKLRPTIKKVRYDNSNSAWDNGQLFAMCYGCTKNAVNSIPLLTADIRVWFYDV